MKKIFRYFRRVGTVYTYINSRTKDFIGEYPQIFLSKDDRIKALNFGWRCYYLEGAELNYKKNE